MNGIQTEQLCLGQFVFKTSIRKEKERKIFSVPGRARAGGREGRGWTGWPGWTGRDPRAEGRPGGAGGDRQGGGAGQERKARAEGRPRSSGASRTGRSLSDWT